MQLETAKLEHGSKPAQPSEGGFPYGLIASQAAEKCSEDVSRSSLWFSVRSLCVSVVSVFVRIFTTETQRTTEIAQRNR